MYFLQLIKILTLVLTSSVSTNDQYILSDCPVEGTEKCLQSLHPHEDLNLHMSNSSNGFKNSSILDIDRRFDTNSIIQNRTSFDTEKDSRLFSIFNVVRFSNIPCKVGSRSGTCYTEAECRGYGGTSLGSCAKGYGQCCYKEISCGGSSSMNCTYLVSPKYPRTYDESRTCSMKINRLPNTCQLRLDFEAFESIGPDEFGVCNDDKFQVPGERKFKYLCGTSPEKWHFYLDVNGQENPTIFNFFTTATSFNRKFKIKVCMIECQQRVPSGCGQYYTGDSGTIQSFNYGGFYLAELDYGICFRKEKNRCTTTFITAGPSFVACPNDLYRIPVGQSGALGIDNNENLYCQRDINPDQLPDEASLATIPSPQTSVTNGPIIIWHKTIRDNNPNYHSAKFPTCPSCAGFHQTFEHNPC